jgi:ADP-heptose:LPS heptosyltransferase
LKILVIRVGRVGDMVMITPALNTIINTCPEAQVDIVTGPDGMRVLRGFHDNIGALIEYDRKKLNALAIRKRVHQRILDEDYAHIYCFELNPSYQKLYAGSQAVIHQIQPGDSTINYAERCLQVVGPVNPRDHEWLYLPVTEAGRGKARQVFESANVNCDASIVGLHASFSGLRKARLRSQHHRHQKTWPEEAFAALARQLVAYGKTTGHEIAVVMDMLPDERDLGERIVAASDGAITLLTPEPDFERYKAALQAMNLLVVPNTGPMHIAGAVGTPVVALFSELDPRDCGPYVPPDKVRYLRAEDTAEPDKGLAAISVGAVFEACKAFLPV